MKLLSLWRSCRVWLGAVILLYTIALCMTQPLQVAGEALLQFPEGQKPVALPYDVASRSYMQRMHYQLDVHYQPWNSGLMRIRPDDCVEWIKINDIAVANFAPGGNARCYPHSINFDFTPYLAVGKNVMEVQVYDRGYSASFDVQSSFTITYQWPIMLAFGFGLYCLWPLLVRAQRFTARRLFSADARTARHTRWALAAAAVCIIVFERLYYLDFVSQDMRLFLTGWLNAIRTEGIRVYGTPLTNYMPLYSYQMGLMNWLMPTANPVYVIKTLSFLGELFAAFFAFRLIRHLCPAPSLKPWFAAFLLLISPSVAINSGAMGQCDIWYTGFMLACIDALIRRRATLAMVAFGFAISSKFQAFFLAPLLLACLLRGDIKWRHALAGVATFAALPIPSWLLGRPYWDMALLYVTEAKNFSSYVGNAANFYYLAVYSEQAGFFMMAGKLMGVAAALAFSIITLRRWRDHAGLHYLMLATFICALMPFLLPHMLDRYFFAADVLAVLVAVVRPRWFALPLLLQTASLLVYPRLQFPPLAYFTSWQPTSYMQLGSLLTCAALFMLGLLCYFHIWRAPTKPGGESLLWKEWKNAIKAKFGWETRIRT